MKIGNIYIQRHPDMILYVKPLRQLKNGGFAGLMFRDYLTGRFGGKAIKTSLAHMYPPPALVENVPAQVLEKFRRAEA